MIDTELAEVNSQELFYRGLVNLWREGKEGGYLVQHGTRAVSDFPVRDNSESGQQTPSFWAKAFPMLFPYGVGAPESYPHVTLSLADHVRWLLEQYDHRFRVHPMFAFMVCSVEQRRQALLSARIQMRRRDFDKDAQILSNITVEDLRKAAEEEERKLSISNPAVRLLKRRVFATASRVFGTDSVRYRWRNSMWSTGVRFGPPSVWATINPDDLHDPLVQLLVGEEINMDRFYETLERGPDRTTRARNVAADGFAAAKFFHFLIDTILETLFGIKVNDRRVHVRKGVFGYINAYFGAIECQGRGTLHFHLLIWLQGAPTVEEMRELLKSEEFRAKVRKFTHANFRAYHARIATEDAVKALPSEPEVAYCRPPNPLSNRYWNEVDELEARVVRTKQIHSCGPGCQRPNCYGVVVCKRRAPWPLADDDIMEESGYWQPKRSIPSLNNYIPAISVNVRCNNDGKFLPNAGEALGLTFYTTGYAAKKQNRSYNMSALLAKTLAYHQANNTYMDDLRESQRMLLFRATNMLNKQQELPMPIVMSYLMGRGECKMSHKYIPLYWSSFRSALLQEYPELSISSIKRASQYVPSVSPIVYLC